MNELFVYHPKEKHYIRRANHHVQTVIQGQLYIKEENYSVKSTLRRLFFIVARYIRIA